MTALSSRASFELGAYRVAASGYRAIIAARRAWSAQPARRVLAERLGRWNCAPAAPSRSIWVHAASLGEVLTATPLIARLHAAAPALRIVLTCHTATGRQAGLQTSADEVRTFPIDTAAVVARIVARIRPVAFVFVETEIWPSLLLSLAQQRVPAVMVNANVSERSLRRYRAAAALFGAALATLEAVCARDEQSKDRLLALGAPRARTRVTGDLKSDLLDEAALSATADLLAGVDAPTLVAASTHEGEDEPVLAALRRVRARHPRARLVLAPRHPERAASVTAMATAAGLRTVRWSSRPATTAWEVLVVDTTGELRGFLRSAAAVFVGGSLVPIGGHNLFEPAAFARAVATGPSLHGVVEQSRALENASALAVVTDAESLAAWWSACLDAPEVTARTGVRARAVVRAEGGALARTLDVVTPLLSSRVATDRGSDALDA